jgi:hypothetical protein
MWECVNAPIAQSSGCRACRIAGSSPIVARARQTEGLRPIGDGSPTPGSSVLQECAAFSGLGQSRWVCRSIFVARFLSTNRRSLGSIGFPHEAQMTVFDFRKNMSASEG